MFLFTCSSQDISLQDQERNKSTLTMMVLNEKVGA